MSAHKPRSSIKTYYPLILILSYLLAATLLPRPVTFMTRFMGGFFLIFSFFKFLDLKGFARAYQGYDIIARRWNPYGMLYPFIELALGLSYLCGIAPKTVNIATFAVMSISGIGVTQSLLARRQIQCACLGTVIQLPMTQITLFEDLLMAALALLNLVAHAR